MPVWGRLLVCVVAGFAVGLVGSAAHRMGVPWNIPYGLVMSLILVALSTWSARARAGGLGVGFHLIASGFAVMLIASHASNSRALIIFGYLSDSYSPLMQKAGIIWLLGMVAVQVLMLVLPASWFRVSPRRPYPHESTH
ncbi:alcohol dehydrogenase [Bifidobacterium sp. 82T24]|uniref:alcohol dehydrogenase n=1 Tax=Bifidobacterium pluvialisilvae TaxID=2834436 RepID=UPI001C595E6B|nr:alcohol dehydrogenase [Bifidobacterium pluvialisilvae]MBW3087322.1 alcohol dehydrogenase [Bifidobacterium pluvialisilvae]